MIQRILSCLLITIGAVITSCDDDDDKVKTFSAQVDATNASIGEDRYHALVLFSTDGGTTYVEYPQLKPGDSYKAKVVYADNEIGSDDCYVFDWAGSQPAPSGATNDDVADFVMEKNSAIKVTVSDYKPYSQATWTGAWIGTEDGACCAGDDSNGITQDPANPNKFTMDNFWGDHVDAFFIMAPSTNWFDQTVEMPEQETSEGGIASGSGTYDQCRNTFTLATTYILDGDTLVFDYNFHRPE